MTCLFTAENKTTWGQNELIDQFILAREKLLQYGVQISLLNISSLGGITFTLRFTLLLGKVLEAQTSFSEHWFQ